MTRILIVEDDPALRSNLQRLLRIEGFDTQTAENGQTALALIEESPPDLVLSDVSMPIMDGHQLLTALRSNPATGQLPVILLTAMADRTSMRRGMNIGADDYLTKPFQREEVLDAIRTRLSRTASQRAATARLENEARRLRHIDTVTGLPNRTCLVEQLPLALESLRSQSTAPAFAHLSSLSLLVIDLIDFNRINDSLGHAVGNKILRIVAERLRQQLSQGSDKRFNSVARLGGVRFAVTVSGGEPAEIAERLLASLAEAIELDEQEFFLDACAGVAHFPDNSSEAEPLLEQAETALNEAKRAGPGKCVFYSAEMNTAANARLRLHNDLHRALERQELQVWYQPQVCVASARIIGFEALIRWQHPELGWISPVQFIPVAEENGLILPIGAWVMETACLQARDWLDRGATGLRMAVNLSTRQFDAEDLCQLVTEVLERSRLPAAQLELEITEGTAMLGAERTIATLNRLKALGIQLALDDFGTGYSSLSYLKRFPLDVLKVDQSFVRNITTDPGDAAITRAVVSLARSFGMAVIAEGVETAEHLEFIAQLGCDDYQGYYFSKPLPANEIESLLARQFALTPKINP